jgi:pimeloyl-ACP methyl ester carboxylesterase
MYKLLSFVLVFGLGVVGMASAQPFTVLHVTQQRMHGIDRIHYIVQNGDHPLNRFGVERIVLAGPLARVLAIPVILEPALGNSARLFTLGNEPGGADFGRSIAANLARGGLDLFIYSPRETFLAPGQCDEVDCSVAVDWGLRAFLDDLAFIRQLVAEAHPQRRPIIGGPSLGGMVALAAVNELPNAYAGVILGDSTLWITDPVLRAGYDDLCQGLNAALAAGQVLDHQLNSLAQLIVHLALTAPHDPSPLPLFPAGTTNRQAYFLFLSEPQPGPPLSIFPTGMVLVAGSVVEDRFFFSSESRVNSQIQNFNFYIANATVRDVVCSFAGDETFVANLEQYTGPILSFEPGRGFGALAHDAIALMSSSDVESKSHPRFGHIDLFTSPLHGLLFALRVIVWVYTDVVF